MAAGLDPAINKLHWFLCGFEGAVLVRNSDMFPELPIGATPGHRRLLVFDDVRPIYTSTTADVRVALHG